jgi:hypothetical protein
MKKILLFISALCLFGAFVSVAGAQEDIPLVPLTPPINPALINIVGTWDYTSSASSVTGMCPPGLAAFGTVTITGGAGAYTVVFISGRECSPASMCTFTGTLSGNTLLVSNADTVDDEGGSAGNALNLTVYNNQFISGSGSSSYIHPEGFECHWSYTINLTRETL